MSTSAFFLSGESRHCIARHLVFWLVYLSYFYIQSVAPRKYSEFFIADTWYFAFLNVCCFGPVLITMVYVSIFFLLPRFLIPKRYAVFIAGFLLLYLAGTVVNYFTADIFLSHVHYSTPKENNFRHRLEFGNYNTRWAMVISVVAMGIRLEKFYYLQQQENVKILRNTLQAEWQLQKSAFHPEFLLDSLGHIRSLINTSSDAAPSMILKMADLLSYSVYENDKANIPLEKELAECENLLQLQHKKNRSDSLSMDIFGDPQGRQIIPMSLLKLVEENLQHTGSSIIAVTVEADQLRVKSVLGETTIELVRQTEAYEHA
ncbi:histidine kinase [Flavihumibacter solisilvae]|uniref:Signal transduction histidine kinase internal region domain-containing protein n=1 Tax=Flavihumibacter solisilvae TaxID=1349421 RepID=A0A0C1IN01_9BACT|nr:histidine kinase [Flavihumibacter solisilvae]KIC95600.1 hypothetical protein OI18_04905 [Flavihumibacter solisilvae]